MKENEYIQRSSEVEVDLRRVVREVTGHAWLVAAASALCAVLTFVGTYLFVMPKYESAAMFYVNNNALSVGDASFSISSGDLVTSRDLVESYLVILNSRETLNSVIDYADVDRTYSELREMISASAVNETEIFEVIVTSTDPYEAKEIAGAIAYILPKRISTIIDGTSAKIVDSAIVPVEPSSPSYVKVTILGFLTGFALAVGGIALRVIFDGTIRSEEDLMQVCRAPILTFVPDMTAEGSKRKNGLYGTGSREDCESPVLLGREISFAASEAYKLLRTKLQFSFADDEDCRIIGLTSALNNEGKSVTAINLAYSLSQLNKRVLLIDCDMRRPTLAEKLGISKAPGLSSYLTGQSSLENLMQHCHLQKDEEAFRVITAGHNPPNPVELLSSARMVRALRVLRRVFDYVILDLPPVGEVSDAMAVAKNTDGMLLVVRQNYCDRAALADTVRQLDFFKSRIIGVVVNRTQERGGYYGKQYYRKYDDRKYGRKEAGADQGTKRSGIQDVQQKG